MSKIILKHNSNSYNASSTADKQFVQKNDNQLQRPASFKEAGRYRYYKTCRSSNLLQDFSKLSKLSSCRQSPANNSSCLKTPMFELYLLA